VTVTKVVRQTDANVKMQKCYLIRAVIIQQYVPINNLCINLFLSIFSLKSTSMIYLVDVTTSLLVEFVKVVTSIRHIYIFYSLYQSKGNQSLERLDLMTNGLSNQGALLMANMLSNNETLIELDMSNNRTEKDGAKDLKRFILSRFVANSWFYYYG
jgi:hypothetical protein